MLLSCPNHTVSVQFEVMFPVPLATVSDMNAPKPATSPIISPIARAINGTVIVHGLTMGNTSPSRYHPTPRTLGGDLQRELKPPVGTD
jgi:hypothetical protein